MSDPPAAEQPPTGAPDAATTARRRAAARWAQQDPNALRMVTAYICWRCYTGDCAGCCYYGWLPKPGPPLPGERRLRTACWCARARHRGDWAAASSSARMYALDGTEVSPG